MRHFVMREAGVALVLACVAQALVACDANAPRRSPSPPATAAPRPATTTGPGTPAPTGTEPTAALTGNAAPDPNAPPPPPDVEGVDPIAGKALLSRIAIRELRGTLVNVWASWCGSCKREVPMLLGLREAFGPQALDIVFVSADERAKWPEAVAFAEKAGLPLPTYVVDGPLGLFKHAMSPAWRGAIPASFLFDGEAKLRHRWEGPIREHEIAPILQAFLAGENVDGATLPSVSAGRTTE
jgi:thiol-disulfide isomerase/thioredoxin